VYEFTPSLLPVSIVTTPCQRLIFDEIGSASHIATEEEGKYTNYDVKKAKK